MTDEKIMELIIDGDKNKVGILFDRYHIQLYNFFYNRKIGGALSEDLTQNVFEKIIKYAHSFNSKFSFKAWMFRIARNILNDHFSKNKPNNEFDLNKISISTGNVLEKMEAIEKHSQLHRAINLLDKEDRELIHFAKFQKLKYQEIAELLNVSEGSIKTRMYRAMKKLKVNYLKLERL